MVVALLCLAATACGKKGPPLPPLVKLPVAPGDLNASRRSDTVDVQFIVPNANTDSSRPANVARVDVYALTGPAGASDADVVARGARIASLAVKAPRDPNVTFDPDDPDQSEADVDPPEGDGLDQGAAVQVRERLSIAGAASTDVRTYVGIGITTRGRAGPVSRRAVVPLVPAPPPPPKAEVTYSEKAVTVTWSAPPLEVPAGSSLAYHVYEAKPDPGSEKQSEASGDTQLTRTAIAETEYVDSRMAWGSTRCYAVRTVETTGGLAVESEATPPACVTLRDTFPPAAPKGLQAVASEGVISLIWDANVEPDLDGYILLRAMAPGDELIPVQTSLLHETAFQDPVPSGTRFVYALQAVDRSGNLSPFSERIEETAR